MLLKTDTKGEDLFADPSNSSNIKNSNHKRVISTTNNNYVKVQNSEISSQGTAENTNAMFQSQLNNQQFGGHSRGYNTQSLGNSTGGNQKQQSLNMSNYGGYYTAIQRESTLNENNPTTLAKTGINLTSLLRQNLTSSK